VWSSKTGAVLAEARPGSSTSVVARVRRLETVARHARIILNKKQYQGFTLLHAAPAGRFTDGRTFTSRGGAHGARRGVFSCSATSSYGVLDGSLRLLRRDGIVTLRLSRRPPRLSRRGPVLRRRGYDGGYGGDDDPYGGSPSFRGRWAGSRWGEVFSCALSSRARNYSGAGEGPCSKLLAISRRRGQELRGR